MNERLKAAGAGLQQSALAMRGMLLWVLFKLVQATVAAAFSLVIVAQAVASGVVRLFSDSEALKKVQAAQLASNAAARMGSIPEGIKGVKGTGSIQVRAVAADPSTVKPMHIFVDPSKGESGGSSSDCASGSAGVQVQCLIMQTHAELNYLSSMLDTAAAKAVAGTTPAPAAARPHFGFSAGPGTGHPLAPTAQGHARVGSPSSFSNACGIALLCSLPCHVLRPRL